MQALDFARRHAWDEAHCRRVTTLALSLFDQTSALHGLGPAERGLLEVAGLLHDVGYAVSQSAHHKHSLYLIRNADLDGFTPRERQLVANVARYLPDLDMWAAERNGDLFELEFGRRVEPEAAEVS
jgi:exopolyphosphatase/guanosine-5'-triphosphate,3'-diphosphate pyrophosphatase